MSCISQPSSRTKLEILEPEEIRRRDDLRAYWRELTDRSSCGDRLYGSEDWFFHLAEGQRQKVKDFSNNASIDGGWIVHKTGSAIHLRTSLHVVHEWTVDQAEATVSSLRLPRSK